MTNMQYEPGDRADAFAVILGRALIDEGYRVRLTSADENDQIRALMEVGLGEDDARDVLPYLNQAAAAIKDFIGHPTFGSTAYAA